MKHKILVMLLAAATAAATIVWLTAKRCYRGSISRMPH